MMQQQQHSDVHAASFSEVYASGVKELPASIKSKIETEQKAIAAITDSVAMAPAFGRLGKLFMQQDRFHLGAYFMGQEGKLEKSEKKLTFAGQIFLRLIQETNPSPEVRAWEALEAESLLQKALELNPKNDTTKIALASVYIEGTGQTMNGVQLLLGITKEQPEHISANMLLGKLAIQSGQYDKATGRFETILKQQPENTEAMYMLAEAYKGKGEIAKAIEQLEKCKKIVNNPEFSASVDAYIKEFNKQ